MRRTSTSRTFILAGALATVSIAMACASVPLRTESSTSAIRAAEEVGAHGVPKAALHLQLAKEELNEAKGLSEEGKDEMAASMLMRAEVDAELAVLLSRKDTEKAEAQAAIARVHQLRQDNNDPAESNTP